jgi:8-oxo-dGTP pyrophosphatase MutT (NUDIX family)
MRKLIVSGPVIIEDFKLLVTMDDKEDFYKIPGGALKEKEDLEECAIRELKEETGFLCSIIKKLPTMKIKKRLNSNKVIDVELHHYLAKLKSSPSNYYSFKYNRHVVLWVSIDDIKNGKYPVAPNIKFLIEKGVLKSKV